MRGDARGRTGAPGATSQSYDELLSNPNLGAEEKRRLRAEATIAHTAVLLMRRGDKVLAGLLLEVKNLFIERDWQADEDDLWLEVLPEHISLFTEELLGRLREVCVDISNRQGYGISWVGVREILPSVGPQWREQVREQLSDKRPTNQGRAVRMDAPRFVEDYLAFTNPGELTVYRALKQIQEQDFPSEDTIAIFPLAGGRVPGRTWEPDVIVTHKGRAGVLEIDGPHHNGRRALDNTRDHLLRDAGIAFVDRITVEALGNPTELYAVLRRFLRRLGEAR